MRKQLALQNPLSGLPIDNPLHGFTIRRHVWDVAERLERELGEERDCFIEGCQRDWDKLPAPDGPLTVGIDGGYVRGQHKQGHFEVIVGKSRICQNSVSGTVSGKDDLSPLPVSRNQKAFPDHRSRLCGLSLSGLSSSIQ